ncbi:MAG: hypothetical protein ABIV11_09455 [Gemmatimonadaceae bacterium]
MPSEAIMMPNNSHTRLARALALRLGALALAVCGAAACSEFLVADNPGSVQEPDVNVPAYANLIANGPIFGYQTALSQNTYWNGQFTDELFNREVFVEEGQIDRRDLYSEMTYINAFMYAPMQRARFLGEDAARRLKVILADSATRDLRIARSLAYAGHGYIALGEMMCVTPIDVGAPKTSAEIFADAIVRFQEAITISNATKAYLQTLPTSTANTNAIAAADSVRNFALVGAARAALNRNDKSAAITFANQVPAAFDFRAYYHDNTTGQRTRIFDRLGGTAAASTLANSPFLAMAGDPRIPRTTTGVLNRPLSPPSYSSFSNTVAGATFAAITTVRIASGLEARYIVAEAQGPTPATLVFVNERRAAGLQGAVALTGDALMAELRDQRSRDFYLDNHRLGDLRRYKQFYNVDLFPKGAYPGSTTGGIYNEAVTCWPLPVNELTGNPNIP